MAPAPQPITGRCLCGSVTYTIDAEPLAQGVCHCADCQRQTGSPFSVVVGVPRAAFKGEGSTLSSFATTGSDHGGDTHRSFCTRCGSPVFSIAAVLPELVFVKSGSLDDASWVEPQAEVWTKSAQPWSPHFENAARFDRGPG
jgi:hypothetical protein